MNTERDKSVRVVRRVDTGCVVVVAVLPRDGVSAQRSCVIFVCHHCTLTCVQEKSAGRGLKGSLRGTPRPGRRTLRQRTSPPVPRPGRGAGGGGARGGMGYFSR